MKYKQYIIPAIIIPLISITLFSCGKKNNPPQKVMLEKKLMLGNFTTNAVKPSAKNTANWTAWDKDPADPTQSCKVSYTTEEKMEENNQSVKITYDVDSPKTAYNGMYIQLNDTDISSYKNLVFYVKGDPKTGYTKKFKVELKNKLKEVSSHTISNITDNWKKISIPLNEMDDLTDLTAITEFVVVFVDQDVTQKTGTLYFNNVYFE